MKVNEAFQLRYLRQEQHLMLPKTSSILLIQELYDILFQYVITEEKEQKLKSFIQVVESQIKSKSNAPFSLPISELEFLEEGLQELRLLNWTEIPVWRFEIVTGSNHNEVNYDEELDKIIATLEKFMIVSRRGSTNIVYAYPRELIRF